MARMGRFRRTNEVTSPQIATGGWRDGAPLTVRSQVLNWLLLLDTDSGLQRDHAQLESYQI